MGAGVALDVVAQGVAALVVVVLVVVAVAELAGVMSVGMRRR